MIVSSRAYRKAKWPSVQATINSFSTVAAESSKSGKLTKFALPRPVPEVKTKPITPQQQYVLDRSKFEKELGTYRKQWKEDYEAKWKREEEAREAERKRILAEKAINLREKRERQRIIQERVKKEHLAAYRRYMGIRERNTQILMDRREDQQQRYQALIDDLIRESQCWITKENINEKICEELFKGPCTTGLITKDSQQWRHEAIAMNINRDALPNVDFDSEEGVKNRLGQNQYDHKKAMRNFLAPMVGTGKEREEFNDYVTKFVRNIDYVGAFEEMDMDSAEGIMQTNQLFYETDSRNVEGKDREGLDEDDDDENLSPVAANYLNGLIDGPVASDHVFEDDDAALLTEDDFGNLSVFEDDDEIFDDEVPEDHLVSEEETRELMNGAKTIPIGKLQEQFQDINVTPDTLRDFLESNMSVADAQNGQDERLDALREQLLAENANAVALKEEKSKRRERKSRSEKQEVDTEDQHDDDKDEFDIEKK